jgi:hypothetical protein
MDKETIELAKKEYKQRKGVNERMRIEPVIIRGTTLESDVFVKVNGNKKLIAGATILDL